MDGILRTAGRRSGRAVLSRAGALALAAGLLVGCGSEGGGTDTAQPGADLGYGAQAPASAPTEGATGAPAEQEVIVIEGFDYELPDSVPPGTEIVVRNLDGVGHTVTADEGDVFDVVVGPGVEATFTAPSEPGEYPFHCTPHPAMTATLVVQEEG